MHATIAKAHIRHARKHVSSQRFASILIADMRTHTHKHSRRRSSTHMRHTCGTRTLTLCGQWAHTNSAALGYFVETSLSSSSSVAAAGWMLIHHFDGCVASYAYDAAQHTIFVCAFAIFCSVSRRNLSLNCAAEPKDSIEICASVYGIVVDQVLLLLPLLLLLLNVMAFVRT